MSTSALDTRMKTQYEDRFRFMLPRRSYTIVRVDGRAFHTWARGLSRPYDTVLLGVMDKVALALCREMSGAQMAYVQSNEISVLLTDFATDDTQAWFDNNLQKICSISASVATAEFNQWYAGDGKPPAHFDSRVFQIPDRTEVENYFISRQKDAVRNSVAMLAQSYYSPKELHGANIERMHDMIHAKGDNWADHPARFKHGGAVVRRPVPESTKETAAVLIKIPSHLEWTIESPPVLTRVRGWLDAHIPRYE